MKLVDLIWAVIGPLIVVGVAAAMLVVLSAPRAYAAQPCAGVWVTASYYGKETCHGRPAGRGPGTCHTAAGVPFSGQEWLVAHKTLPMGTRLHLTYGSRSVTVPVLDRGPYVRGRTLDLSEAVARALGTRAAGTAKICMEVQ
jgi:rare lipoprotein A